MDSLALPDLSFNPDARIEGRHIGDERQPLLIIDDVLRHPEQLTDYAVTYGGFAPPPQTSYYPGLNGVLPAGYGPALVRALRPLLEKGFGIPRDQIMTYEGFFGLTTFAPDRLRPLQCVPHFDSSEPLRLAMVHYLCGEPYQGTAFFRHLPTGFESVGHARFARFREQISHELATEATPQAYVDEKTPRYQQTACVAAKYNRLVVYRTTVLHAAMMSGTELSEDPATGRLTANSFIQIAPP